MKIQTLKVHNVRGLVKFSFEPKGKSVVVSGPNGSGKSALVDAVDFLFTGKISRLEGKGTGNVSLQAHGPHVDHQPAEAVVSAEVILNSGKTFTIERKISDAKKLKCTPAPDPEMQEILEIAEPGYHVLTRREILRFIAAEPSSRAQEVQALLNVSQIEELRKLINSVSRNFEQEGNLRVRDVQTFETDIATLLGLRTFADDSVLTAVNSQRRVLGASAILADSIGAPKENVQAPSQIPTASDPVIVADDIKRITFGDDVNEAIKLAEEKIKTLVEQVQKDPELRTDLERRELIDLGLSLIGLDSKCPLCEKSWDVNELREFLEERQKKAAKAAVLQQEAQLQTSQISKLIGSYQPILPRLSNAAEILSLAATKNLLDGLAEKWAVWLSRLSNPLAEYPTAQGDSIQNEFLKNADLTSQLALLDAAAKKSVPEISPEQKAWDLLTKFEVQWSALQKLKTQHSLIENKKEQCAELARQFEKARESVMGGLYTEIETAFIGFYTILHDHEKATFGAKLKPDGAGLTFEVDFHGRGKYPPIAMHSEGHQDSMGLCLYMALMGKLTKEKIGLTILDDVVMSVDSGHRQPVCGLLSEKFGSRQFFITTHDKIWARQLRNAGVVPQENFLTFRDWTVEEGPKWREDDRWKEIEELLKQGEVSKAAAALRRELEEFFDDTCDLLVALIPYSGDARYELSDLMNSALTKLGRLIAKAKDSANSWNKKENVKKISDWDANFTAAKKDSQVEAWIVNPSVHFSRLVQADPKDFAPVLAAFSHLRECFQCVDCRSLLYVSPRKLEEAVRCRCGSVHWNLLQRTKEDEKRQEATVPA